jgi:mono/diheme cytochrome c family protein
VTAAISTDTMQTSFRVTLPRCHFVALSLFLVAGCGWHFPLKPPEKPVPAEDVKDFKKLYKTHCAGCHGKDGNLGAAPPLNDSVFWAIVSDAELLRVVADGRRGTLMPAWAIDKGGPLAATQVKVLAEGIKNQRNWDEAGLARPEGEIPPYTRPAGEAAGDKEEGANVFMMACAGCHGEQGRGGKRIEGKKQIGAVNDPAFLELLSDQALRRYIITGRPDLHMPGYGPAAGRLPPSKPLTSTDVNDLVALLAYWRVGGSLNGK